MACVSPLTAYWSKQFGKSGKRLITFSRGESFSGVPFKVECGQCIECRAGYATDWATRLMHERKCHDFAWFITLTYNDASLPEDRSLSKDEARLFVDRLRKMQWRKFKRRIRYFTAGEYGDDKNRPHYHLIVYNCFFDDLKFYKKNERGESLFSSKLLSEAWQNRGFCTIGEVTYDSAHYCAKYGLKRVTGLKADEYYTAYTADGIIYTLQPEYSTKSNRPGIGRFFFEKYYKEMYVTDSCVVNGKEVPVPKYYDTLYEKIDPAHMLVIKRNRRKRGVLRSRSDTVDRRRAREVIALKRLAQRKRSVA